MKISRAVEVPNSPLTPPNNLLGGLNLKSFVLQHKKAIIIASAFILLAAAVAALIFSHYIQSPKMATEPVPQGRIYDAGVFGDDVVVHDSTEGEIIIEPISTAIATEPAPAAKPMLLVSDPDEIWTENTYAGNHTPVEKAKMQDGSLGILTIDKLGLSVNVFESPDNLEAMTKGIAHFPSTSAWDGVVGFSAHNINLDGSDGYFKNLYTLAEGDLIRYKTALGERTYSVSKVSTIEASDWSPLYYQDYNMVTLITCISGQPNKRLSIQAIEQSVA